MWAVKLLLKKYYRSLGQASGTEMCSRGLKGGGAFWAYQDMVRISAACETLSVLNPPRLAGRQGCFLLSCQAGGCLEKKAGSGLDPLASPRTGQ